MKPTHRVCVALAERSYEVVIGEGLLSSLGEQGVFEPMPQGASVVVVTNDVVGPLLGARVAAVLRPKASRLRQVTLPDGEAHKDWETLQRIFDALLADHCDRNTILVALGGGVIGDLTGFAAACYMRGIAYVQVPTTLLAQVDSSVGGKTAINHPAGKNMIGAFHQPRLVVADVASLSTLPRRELVAGMAEVVKYGAVFDDAFLGWIESHMDALLGLDGDALVHAVRRSCEIKAAVVEADERESGRRALLNFGHTFAHAIEAAVGYGRWLHGEAVGCGMVLAARLSHRLGLIGVERVQHLEHIVAAAGLPVCLPDVDDSALIGFMRSDKKSIAGELRFVLLDDAQKAVVASVPEAVVEGVLLDARRASSAGPDLRTTGASP